MVTTLFNGLISLKISLSTTSVDFKDVNRPPPNLASHATSLR